MSIHPARAQLVIELGSKKLVARHAIAELGPWARKLGPVMSCQSLWTRKLTLHRLNSDEMGLFPAVTALEVIHNGTKQLTATTYTVHDKQKVKSCF